MIRQNAYCWHCKEPRGYTGTGLCQGCRRKLAYGISYVGIDYSIYPELTNAPSEVEQVNKRSRAYVGKRFADDVGFYTQEPAHDKR